MSEAGEHGKVPKEGQGTGGTSATAMGSQHKLSSSSREMRNLAEKLRRDKLNHCVTELASIVPLVSAASKRVDKTSVLRLAANYIRIHNVLQDERMERSTLPRSVDAAVARISSQAMGGFLLVMTSTGKVLFVSDVMEEVFGFSQVDLLGRSVYTVIHPEDHNILHKQLTSQSTSRKSFFCRMLEKSISRNDPRRYEIVHIVGTLRPLPRSAAPPQPHLLSPQARNDHWHKAKSDGEDNTDSESEEGTEEKEGAGVDGEGGGEDAGGAEEGAITPRVGTHLLVAFVRVVKDRPITELSLVEATQDEYITRHSMDGKILYTDHRISFVTGLMPSEVLGTSAFTYMEPEDMVWSLIATKLMISSSQGQGMVSYRLKGKGDLVVTLRSRGYIEINKHTGQADTFVCINTLVCTKESDTEIRNQRRKLLPIIASPEGEEHLASLSSEIPPELLVMVKQLMDPKYQKMLVQMEGGPVTTSLEVNRTSTLDQQKISLQMVKIEPKYTDAVMQDLFDDSPSLVDERSQSKKRPNETEEKVRVKRLCSAEVTPKRDTIGLSCQGDTQAAFYNQPTSYPSRESLAHGHHPCANIASQCIPRTNERVQIEQISGSFHPKNMGRVSFSAMRVANESTIDSAVQFQHPHTHPSQQSQRYAISPSHQYCKATPHERMFNQSHFSQSNESFHLPAHLPPREYFQDTHRLLKHEGMMNQYHIYANPQYPNMQHLQHEQLCHQAMQHQNIPYQTLDHTNSQAGHLHSPHHEHQTIHQQSSSTNQLSHQPHTRNIMHQSIHYQSPSTNQLGHQPHRNINQTP